MCETFGAESVDSIACMASYKLNRAAVAKARQLIEAKQYVLDSDWGESQPKADDENTYLENHSWEDYSEWHLGLTEGANDETKALYAFVYGDFVASIGPVLSPVSTGPRSGGTRRSNWRPTTFSRNLIARPPSLDVEGHGLIRRSG